VGGPPQPVDVRVIASSNADVEQRIRDGQFRRDLYYRVAGLVLRVPPLGERLPDLPYLVEGLFASQAPEADTTVPVVEEEVWKALLAYSWPGNIRELENEVRRL